MSLGSKLQKELKRKGADFVCFVDVSQLSVEQNKGYPNAVLIGIILSSNYIRKISETTDYVEKIKNNNQINKDEFHQKEIKADRMADYIAQYLISKGYSAYSQSENNILATGFYNEKTKSTSLPHKTIAGLAGLGWIGKHNLLVNPEFGSAFCMCTVLTDAPLETVLYSPLKSQCGNCCICKDICKVEAIKGNAWDIHTARDEIVDADKCNTCLKCLVFCTWTQKYINNAG